jgi:hypothetical protein
MSEWITDRRPTEDAIVYGPDGKPGQPRNFGRNQPWKPIPHIEPYVKPKRYAVVEWYNSATWTVEDRVELCLVCRPLPTREAAESMAAIYEELMP